MGFVLSLVLTFVLIWYFSKWVNRKMSENNGNFAPEERKVTLDRMFKRGGEDSVAAESVVYNEPPVPLRFDYFRGERCDQCRSTPQVRFRKTEDGAKSEFTFCGHHGTLNQEKLLEQGYTVVHDVRTHV